MTRALTYLPGRDDILARVLGQFAAGYGHGLPALAEQIEQGRWVQARAEVHALRGACGAVGAVALLDEAQVLEERLRALATGHVQPDVGASEQLRALAIGLDESLRRLVAAIRAARLDELPAPAVALDIDALAQQRLQLDRLLERADFAANACLREAAATLRAAFGDAALRRIEEPLRRYDHETALAALRSLPGAQPQAAGAPDQ